MKITQLALASSQPRVFVRSTSKRSRCIYSKRETEDYLDHLHRLLGLGLKTETVAVWTGFPSESVDYVRRSNGYDKRKVFRVLED